MHFLRSMELPLIYTRLRAALAGRAAAAVRGKCSGNREVASGLENKAVLKGEIYTNSCWVWELVTGLVFCMVPPEQAGLGSHLSLCCGQQTSTEILSPVQAWQCGAQKASSEGTRTTEG